MGGGGISEVLSHVGPHRLGNLGVHGRGGVVVQVDGIFGDRFGENRRIGSSRGLHLSE